MKHRTIALLATLLTLPGCFEGTPNPSPIRGPYMRTEDSYRGYHFTGAFFTPGGDVALSVYNAPVPCGRSACASGEWQGLGTVKAGVVGGDYPFTEGKFQLTLHKEALTQRRGVSAPCYPGGTWTLMFGARDLATNKFIFSDGRPSTAGFFTEVPRCP